MYIGHYVRILVAQFILQTLLLLSLSLPYLATLEIDMLSDKTRSVSFAKKGRIFCRVTFRAHKESIFRQIVHNHVLKFDVAHVTLFIDYTGFGHSAYRWDGASLIT